MQRAALTTAASILIQTTGRRWAEACVIIASTIRLEGSARHVGLTILGQVAKQSVPLTFVHRATALGMVSLFKTLTAKG